MRQASTNAVDTNITKLISLDFLGPGNKLCTVYSPRGVGSVVTKRLPGVAIFTMMEGVDGQLETRRDILDRDDKLLIHEPSGRLDRQIHTKLLPVHLELSRQIK